MNAALPLFIIEADGSVTEHYTDRLPETKQLQAVYFAGQGIEHVTVLWQSKRAHAFVDEMGAHKALPVNAKATAIYHNATRRRAGLSQCRALHESPDRFLLDDAPRIYGRLLLWPHSAPGWEPGS